MTDTQMISDALLAFLDRRTGTTWTEDADLFDSGVVSSLFALELVLHMEKSFGVSVGGADLAVENFRTVNAMTALVLRLRDPDE
ncbi:acyl carrier protein [Nonomuraea guangzhouensis]|uniref:Acyl carrier protein n=1 Tax=Nonomuraea guangzhouensis TaxID=1291555 RepID=A0ABW4GDP0_9ACTN|nr:acyl carrier protein [Nonomuraea guangzhouensis]